MDANELVQKLSVEIYKEPLSNVRQEIHYPDLDNPLHLAILLLDYDTEVSMNGMLGFLENSTGQYLMETIEGLERIRAVKASTFLRSVRTCMDRHAVTWERLRGDFADLEEFQVTTFRELHGEGLSTFANEVCALAAAYSLFGSGDSTEDPYALFCEHLQARIERFHDEIRRRKSELG